MKTGPESNGRPLAYSYIRFSSIEQAKGDSLRRQTQLARDWCERNGARLVEDYQDLGVSAFRGKHATTGNFARLLGAIRKGRIPRGSFLLVESLDRLGRDEIDEALSRLLDIIRAGVTVVTVADGQVYNIGAVRGGNIAPLVMSLVFMARARNESEEKQKRCKAAWRKKQEAAQAGELLSRHCPSWLRLNKAGTGFDVDRTRAAIVRRVFSMAEGGWGAFRITKALRADGTPTISGRGQWSTAVVLKLLHSKAAIGSLVLNDITDGIRSPRAEVKDYYPAVISPEVFATVQVMLTARRNCGAGKNIRSRRSRGTANAFSGLVFSEDGGAWRFKLTYYKGRRYKYLAPRDGDGGRSWRYKDFVSDFKYLCRHAIKADLRRDETADRLSVKQQELSEAEGLVQKRADLLERSASPEMFKRLQEAEGCVAGLKADIAALQSASKANVAGPESVVWESLEGEELQRSISRAVKRIVARCDGVLRGMWVEFIDGRRMELVRSAAGDRAELTRTAGDKPAFRLTEMAT